MINSFVKNFNCLCAGNHNIPNPHQDYHVDESIVWGGTALERENLNIRLYFMLRLSALLMQDTRLLQLEVLHFDETQYSQEARGWGLGPLTMLLSMKQYKKCTTWRTREGHPAMNSTFSGTSCQLPTGTTNMRAGIVLRFGCSCPWWSVSPTTWIHEDCFW